MRAFLPDTIRGQVVTAFLMLFLLLTLPLTWLLVQQSSHLTSDEREHALIQQTSQAAMLLGGFADVQMGLDQLAGTSNLFWAVYEADGALLASAVHKEGSAPAGFPPPITAEMLHRTVIESNGLAFSTESIPGPDGLILLAAIDADSVRGASWPMWERALAGFVIIVPVFLGAGWWIARRISGPLVALRDQSAAIAAGHRSIVEPIAGSRGVRDLATTINSLSGQVNTLTIDREDTVRRLEQIFEHMREGLIVVDADEVVIAENACAREILGNQNRSGVGMQVAIVLRDHVLLNHLRDLDDARDAATIPIEYARSGRSIEATMIPLQGNRSVRVVVLRDVTEIRKLELVRREFVANVSHELRTPLASIRALADTLESGAIDDREVATGFLGRIGDEVDRLTALVEELLDLARLQSGRVVLARQAVQSSDVVQAGVDRLRPQIDRADLTVGVKLVEPMPVIMVDQARIEQVLINLLHNAVKFTPAGGAITVTAWGEQDGLRVDVEDTGTGIPEEELTRVFERFYKADRSRRSEGTGLGLAISTYIIRAHHGEIWATSTVGQGSTFSFWVPASPHAAIADSPAPE